MTVEELIEKNADIIDWVSFSKQIDQFNISCFVRDKHSSEIKRELKNKWGFKIPNNDFTYTLKRRNEFLFLKMVDVLDLYLQQCCNYSVKGVKREFIATVVMSVLEKMSNETLVVFSFDIQYYVYEIILEAENYYDNFLPIFKQYFPNLERNNTIDNIVENYIRKFNKRINNKS